MAKPTNSKLKEKKLSPKSLKEKPKTIFVHYLFYIFCNKS